jgi:dihydrofolate synthase/folylpolyglutamate synthase
VNERFQINGESISNNTLEKYYKKVLNLTKIHNIPLSFFEIQVVVMVLYFVAEKVDYAVVEVGLGGTHDGTNIFTHPLACFITSITLEHIHVLGKTRTSILKNKL